MPFSAEYVLVRLAGFMAVHYIRIIESEIKSQEQVLGGFREEKGLHMVRQLELFNTGNAGMAAFSSGTQQGECYL